MRYTESIDLVNFPYFRVKFEKSDLMPIIDEVTDMEKNPSDYEAYNSNLAGQIKKEFNLTKSKKYLNELLLPYVKKYMNETKLYTSYHILSEDRPLFLEMAWANFQKKYEYNPVHNHSGLVSFVLYLNIPYDMAKEKKSSPGRDSNMNAAGSFEFHFPSPIMGVLTTTIQIDQSMLYNCLIFPSSISHSVHPFYYSKGTRISISGNFYLLV